jgi:conjugal transfer mating pair stabilization protein TraN
MRARSFRPVAQIALANTEIRFTPEEFQMLDFSRIDLSEWHDEIQIRALEQIQTEMDESIEDHNEEFE